MYLTTALLQPNVNFTTKMKKRSERRKHCARAGCSKVRTSAARRLQTRPQTGPITIH